MRCNETQSAVDTHFVCSLVGSFNFENGRFKFLLVSRQLVLFGLNNQLVVSYKEENTMTLKSLFLKDYSGVDEDDYSIAVYTQQGVYDSLFYVLDQASPATASESKSWT